MLALIRHHGRHEIGFILAIKVSILHGHRCWASTGVEVGQGGQGARELSEDGSKAKIQGLICEGIHQSS